MSLRNTLRKAASLLVELPPEPASPDGVNISAGDAAQADVDAILARMGPAEPPAAKTVEQIVHESPGPNLEQIRAGTAAAAASAPLEGEVDLKTIYQQAGLPAAPFTAEQMLEMLESLPAELPLDTKRQTVKVTLSALGKTMGATPETIVADASRKLAALTAYHEHVSEQTQSFAAESQQQIADLQAQIEAKKKEVETAGVKLRELTARCEKESQRLDQVLEFFSLDVPPSVHAPGAAGPSAGGNPPVSANQ